MAAEIKVGIGADVKGLEKGLATAEKDIKAFDVAATKSLQNFEKQAIKSTKAVGVNFQGTSRVLSDAAFGPGAIANNLEALGREFGDLSRAAKESGQSIGKTLIQSLAGGGGLNLALGGLTLALSLASFGMGAWTRAFGTNKKAVDDTKKSTEDYIKSLSQIEQAQLKGAQNAQEELAGLRVLFAAYQDGNQPLKERREAYRQLQDKYPAYFANLQFEEGAATKTKDAYNQLTSAILSTARARAAEALIAKNSATQLENEQKILDIERNRIPLIKQGAELQKKLTSLQKDTSGSEARAAIAERVARQLLDIQNQIALSIQSTNELKLQNNRLTDENIRLEKEAVKNVVNEVKETEKVKKVRQEIIKDREKELKGGFSIQDQVFIKGFKTPPIDTSSLQIANDQIANHFREMKAKFQLASNDLAVQNQIISQGFQDAFAGLGEALGNALAQGENPIKAAGAAILGAIGGVLVQFGKMTIAAGIASTALATALKNPFNPASGVAAIAAGIGLVAIGSAVKAFAGGLGKSASGSSGGNTGGGSFNPGVSSGFNPAAPATGGGSFQTVFIPSMTLKGNDIVVAFNRTNALNNRTGR